MFIGLNCEQFYIILLHFTTFKRHVLKLMVYIFGKEI